MAAPGRNIGFPFRAPTVPRGVEVPVDPPSLGADYDSDWARSPAARVARGVIAEGPMRLAVRGLAAPEIFGLDRLDDLRRRADRDDAPPPPVIFAPNHHSHLDTALMVRAVPFTWRKRLVVAAAADYFFDKRWKATLSALSLNAIPIDRESTGRRSADMIRELVEDGWSLVIYPEGGRSPDGWGQTFKGGAAYLSGRTGAPGRAGVHRRHRLDLRQGHEAAPARAVARRVRVAADAGRRREHPPLQRPHRGRRRRARRRGDDRLLDGPPAGGRRHQSRAWPDPSTPAGAGSGTCPSTAGQASPAGVARRSAAGPTSAERARPAVTLGDASISRRRSWRSVCRRCSRPVGAG